MAATEKRKVEAVIRDAVLPVFASMNYDSVPLSKEDLASAEIRKSFPFGRVRKSVEGRIFQAEVQIHRRDERKVRVNFGSFSLGGIDHPVAGKVAAQDVWVHYLERYYALYKFPPLKIWFYLDINSTVGGGEPKGVRSLSNALQEIDDLLEQGRKGRHVKTCG
ncbi:hypothetical protein [Luteimonas huabeiensis]|uniref:hypothetical protein n=1 Tax=Luteimonas huabeiensis TaxID=1244513 RepID=UPI001364651A|nr:hypothetical protein [Luteimonas huabeiensis]